eukprot:COSAG04_NODE_747_length_10615_cov_4.568372_3_plen_161_part_00
MRHFPSANASGCCGPCADDEQCVGYTFNSADGGNCWLKKAVGKCSPGGTCTSAVVAGRHSAPVPPPPPYPGPLTCGYTGKVPPEPLRTKPSECHDMTCCSSCFRSWLSDAKVALSVVVLFDLKADPGEHTDLAESEPDTVKTLMARLQVIRTIAFQTRLA